MQHILKSSMRGVVRTSVLSAIFALGVLPTAVMAQEGGNIASGINFNVANCSDNKGGQTNALVSALMAGMNNRNTTAKKLDEDSLLVLHDFATKEKPVIKIDTTISTLTEFQNIPLAEVGSVNFTTYARLAELQDAETVKKKYGKQITKGLLTVTKKPDPCAKKEEPKKE